MIPLDFLNGRTVAVLGLGRSGLSTVAAARAGGATVVAWDDGEGARAAAGDVTLVPPARMDWSAIDLLVLAPGIPLTHPEPHPAVRMALDADVEIVGDIELFVRARPAARIVAITGTNGKSTTTALVGHILAETGRAVAVAGNIGRPVLDLDPLPDDAVHVFEMSSFQIDLTSSLRPEVAALLNMTPDHLDRHGDMDGYVAAKWRLFANMDSACHAVVGVDDRYGVRLVQHLSVAGGPQLLKVKVGEPQAGTVYVIDGNLFVDGLKVMDIAAASALPGPHNHQNAAVAFAICHLLGLRTAEIVAGIRSFPGLPHRIEKVGALGGIRFYNDSKATNPDAAAKALAAFDNIYWIAGGKPKDGRLDAVFPYLGRVRRAYLIGQAEARFAAELAGRVDCVPGGTLHHALELAWADARAEGEGVILLSPACASFDQFRSFEHRGDVFRDAVQALLATEATA